MDVAKALTHAGPFSHAPAAAIEDLAKVTVVRNYQREQELWRAGDPAGSFSVIYSGLVKIVRPLPNGREAIVGLFGPRESVGDVAVLQGIAFPAGAIVCSASAVLLQIARNELLDQMKRHPGLALSINQSMGDRVHLLHEKIQILSAGGVDARLSSLLLDLAERFGDEFEDDTVVIPIALSRQDLANLVSTTLETAIRTMSRWQKAGIVETNADGFVLRDMAKLREAASSVLGPRGA